MEYLAATSAGEHFKQDVELDFRIEEGSLKGWVTVAGGLYAAVCGYGSFRSGIDYIVKDAQGFSESIITSVRQNIQMPSDAVYRTERRLGVPGRIQRIYPLLKVADEILSRGQNEAAQTLLRQAKAQIQKIEEDLQESQKSDLVQLFDNSIPSSIRQRIKDAELPEDPAQPFEHEIFALAEKRRPGEILGQRHTSPKPPSFN